MSTALLPPPPRTASALRLPLRWEAGSIWRAPLVPVALVVTAGILVDRYAPVPLLASVTVSGVALLAWTAAILGRQTGLALVYLWTAVGALAAGYHHWYLEVPADDVSRHATDEPQPVSLRGTCESEPVVPAQGERNPLRSFQPTPSTRLLLRAHQIRPNDAWRPVSGFVLVTVAGKLEGRHVGDEIELEGLFLRPQSPANPGEFDYPAFLRDQQLFSVLAVRSTEDVKLLAEGSPWSVARSLALVRNYAVRTLQKTVRGKEGKLAAALLLGENSALPAADWEAYQRTGVVHVLAISGQHLVVLGGLLWLTLRPWQLPRRWGAVLVGLFVLAYALLAGGRPPVMRSAVVACALCGSLLIRRPMLPANSFALAWLVVAVLNPTDVFNAGCQLSFLAVAVLRWGTTFWGRAEENPLDRLVEVSLPAWRRRLGWLGSLGVEAYTINFAIWLAVAPLAAAHFHTVQPAGILIGPPVVLLTSVALVGGFLFLLLEPLLGPFAQPFALATRWSLGGADWLVEEAANWPWGYCYIADVPRWWTWAFYPALLASLTLAPLRLRWRWTALAGVLWLLAGLLFDLARPAPGELRCTFLAVGHGGCTVLETPDGRTLLYDAGAITGPELTRRQVAPFLWSQGIRRIDELFLSHADLDHYNGLPALLERFAIGQVSCTPTFQERRVGAVKVTLDALERRGVPVRVLRAGDRLTAGPVRLDVLHPPARGPEGIENVRSLVLLVRHGGHSILLTGDLEGAGLEHVLSLPRLKVDVLMAPHHGSPKANPLALAKWARPTFVVSCQGRPRSAGRAEDAYKEVGSRFLGTWPDGAVAVRSRAGGLVVEVFRNGAWLAVPPKADR